MTNQKMEKLKDAQELLKSNIRHKTCPKCGEIITCYDNKSYHCKNCGKTFYYKYSVNK